MVGISDSPAARLLLLLLLSLGLTFRCT